MEGNFTAIVAAVEGVENSMVGIFSAINAQLTAPAKILDHKATAVQDYGLAKLLPQAQYPLVGLSLSWCFPLGFARLTCGPFLAPVNSTIHRRPTEAPTPESPNTRPPVPREVQATNASRTRTSHICLPSLQVLSVGP